MEKVELALYTVEEVQEYVTDLLKHSNTAQVKSYLSTRVAGFKLKHSYKWNRTVVLYYDRVICFLI